MHGEHFDIEPDTFHDPDIGHLGGESDQLHSVLGPSDITYEPGGDAVQGPAPTHDAFGDPGVEAHDWQFQGDRDGMCGPTSIAMVVNELGREPGGQPLTGADVAQWAIAHGDMTSDGHHQSASELGYGMTPGQISAVLDHYGVQSEEHSGGNLHTLEGYLAGGHQVVLSVDAYQLWHNVPADQDPDQANHAVVLTGIDPHTGYAYINDPGTPDGRDEAVPISELMSAWSTSDYTSVMTEDTAGPEHAPSDVHPAHPGYVILPVVLHHELVELKDELIADVEQLEHDDPSHEPLGAEFNSPEEGYASELPSPGEMSAYEGSEMSLSPAEVADLDQQEQALESLPPAAAEQYETEAVSAEQQANEYSEQSFDQENNQFIQNLESD
jgi:hypothetical protein